MTEVLKRTPGNPHTLFWGPQTGGPPDAHAASHKAGGADPIRLDELEEPTDVPALNASVAKHGLLPKLPGGTTNFLREDGTWQPAGGSTPVATTTTQGKAKVDHDSAGDPVALTAAGHAAAADPHPQYALDSEKGAASGIATLDAGGKHPAGQVPFGSGANTVCQGNDARLSDARTPTAHATSHQNGGADEISVAGLSGLLADAQTPAAHTHAAADINSGQLAMARIASGTPDGTKFVRDDGVLAVPSGGGGDPLHWARQAASRVLTSSITEQALFDATHDTLTLPTGVYFFECLLSMTGMSATAGNAAFDIIGAGTAVLADILYTVVGVDASPAAVGTRTGTHSVTAQTAASMVAAATTTAMVAQITGTFEVTTAGTIIPSITLVTAAAATVAAGTFFKCQRVGAIDATSGGGAWS